MDINMNNNTHDNNLEAMRHSASHVMAEAVLEIFPDAKLGIGPAIDNGFYYDFDLPRSLTPEDLPIIAAKMQSIIENDLPFIRADITRKEAKEMFANQPYKLELIEDIPDETLSIYSHGGFTDLCRGPHVSSTGQIKAFKLTGIAGAYWRGSEKNAMLQRIYGLAFETDKDLENYLDSMEEAAKRDHRKLGKELDLFGIYEEGGPGLVCWHPKGAMVRRVIEDFWKLEHDKRGYSQLYTPHIAKLDLWKKSGHWDYYRENLYSPMTVDEDEYLLKPMNCLYHIMIYNSRPRSYRELPIRYAELGTVYRYEPSGTLHGLSRVRGFTQDDSHIFCRYNQLEDEVADVLDLAMFMVKTFGFDRYQVKLSTRPDKFAGSEDMWEHATSTLQRALEKKNISYEVDPGEGVFYGPKIDIKFEDAMKRAWQGPTIQVDFNNPQRFNVTYIGEDGQEQPAAMVHRTVLGSMERFMACLIEHYGGAFPLWLAPVQVMVLPVADRHIEYANTIAQELRHNLIRVEVDTTSSTVNHKIRDAQMKKIPCMIILGDREQQADMISVRWRDGAQDNGIALSSLITSLIDSIENKVL
jgi:threonyl-tRNA synthetase